MSNFDVVFPAKGRQQFDGGLSTKYERSIIEDNESPDCLNVVFSNGAVETRGGVTKLNTTAVGSFVFDGLYTRRDNLSVETMVAFAGGTAWQLIGNSTFTTIGSAQSVFTAGQRVSTTQYENHMFIGNGGVTPYKYNGVHFTRHGVPQATGTVSVNCTGAGSLAGVVRYKVAFVNSQAAIGDVGPATTAYTLATGSSKTVRVSAIPIAAVSHGVNARRIYRSIDGGAYGLVSTLNDNTTTVFDDDGTTVSSTTAPTDNGEPPKYSVITQHQNRLFCDDVSNPGYVWYSNLYEPYTFASTNFRPIGDSSRDLVKGLDVYDNSVVVFCENSVYLIYMPSTDDTDWQSIRIRTQYGSKSPFSSFLYDNKLLFGAMQNTKFAGFAAIGGSTIDPEATKLDTFTAGSDLKSDRIEPDMFDIVETYVRNISSMVYKNKAYIAVTSVTGATNNAVYVFDFSNSNLSKDQRVSWSPLDGIAAAQFTVYNGMLYFGSATATGFVHQLETATYNDNTAAINSYIWTKEFAGIKGHENLQKDFRRIKLLVEKTGAYYMNVTYRVDSDSGDGTTVQVNLDPGGTVWNAFTWDVDDWGGGNDQEEASISLGQVSGKRLQLKFSNQNTANQRFKVYGLNITYNIKGKR